MNDVVVLFGQNDDAFSDETFHAVQNHNNVGWDQPSKGKPSKHWANAQETLCSLHKKDRKHSAQTWSGKFTQASCIRSQHGCTGMNANAEMGMKHQTNEQRETP